MISGKARELFLKWFREEKQLTCFEFNDRFSETDG